MRTGVLGFAAALCVAACPLSAQFVPMTQSRSLMVSAMTFTVGPGLENSVDQTFAPDFGPFNETDDAVIQRAFTRAEARASQASALGPSQFTITAAADTLTGATIATESAQAQAASNFDVVFDITFDGSVLIETSAMDEAGDGALTVTFARTVGSPPVITLEPGNTPPMLLVDTPPGTYRIVVRAASASLSNFDQGLMSAQGSAEFSGAFTAGPPLCEGDANFDRSIDFDDITAVLTFYDAEYPAGATWLGDADRDGVVRFADLTEVLKNFGQPCP